MDMAQLLQLSDPLLIEDASKQMEVAEFLSYLAHSVPNWKIAAFLTGVSPKVFRQFLSIASESQLHVLKQEALAAPLRHHLSLFIQAATAEFQETVAVSEKIEQAIEQIDPDKSTREEVLKEEVKIDQLAAQTQHLITQIDRALAIAWNINDPAIVQQMSSMKEAGIKFAHLEIGSPHSLDKSATGLYRAMENRLFSVYGEWDGKEQPVQKPLTDTLEHIHIWFLEEYFILGLLPEIESRQEAIELEKQPEQRRYYLQKVQERFGKLGLHSVQDLKRAWIFSRASLIEFLGNDKRP